MQFLLVLSLLVSLVAARHDLFVSKRVAVERCFAYPAADDPNFLHCLQDLICSGPTFPNSTTVPVANSTVVPTPAPPPPTTTVSVPSPCSPDGACDCSKIEDKDGDEYFQCITNPACERCHLSTTTTTSSSIASPTLTQTTPRTFSPGTYTVLINGTTSIMVLPTQATVTLTKVVTPDITSDATTSSEATPYATNTACHDCDCSLIADKQSEDYFECMTDPECETCRSGQQARLFNRKGFVRRM
ncbi:hypothetical protein VHEMI09833 [[Torrubiella] hemipterigena]|uniref:Cytochrome c domain-containing protein n=1 Tax=[Torrubiella] hemipterigena TaxID=1531966 RepID=A0A0A1TS88_9HYPO|nr:hypothetical protein VHEMI09833 [[Torrubiella] hemipterigena]